ncbi:MAG: peptidyl-tRNA hydrolase [Phycisphaerae bacterium]|nr:MAG: peptidyl-tRNA hydrolase [Phycisphaerae bacterium]
MKLIVGLGNPGTEYAKTRHNAGFMVVDRLAHRHGAGAVPRARFKAVTTEVSIGDQRCLLLKPTTYMNLSGQSVGEAVAFFKVLPADDLLVIVDDLYLPTGTVRLRPGGGTGGHNGLEDLHRVLAGDGYPRLRVGVGVLPGGGKPPHIDQADYVLSRFTDEEQPLLESALQRATSGAELWATRGLAHAMNTLNAPEGKGPSGTSPGTPPPTGGNDKERIHG